MKKIRMLVSSTMAPAGRVIARPQKEAERLIAAGHAEPFHEPDFEIRLSHLEHRVGKIESVVESAMVSPPENAAQPKAKPKKGE